MVSKICLFLYLSLYIHTQCQGLMIMRSLKQRLWAPTLTHMGIFVLFVFNFYRPLWYPNWFGILMPKGHQGLAQENRQGHAPTVTLTELSRDLVDLKLVKFYLDLNSTKLSFRRGLQSEKQTYSEVLWFFWVCWAQEATPHPKSDQTNLSQTIKVILHAIALAAETRLIGHHPLTSGCCKKQ